MTVSDNVTKTNAVAREERVLFVCLLWEHLVCELSPKPASGLAIIRSRTGKMVKTRIFIAIAKVTAGIDTNALEPSVLRMRSGQNDTG
jgi:hypothetical protein